MHIVKGFKDEELSGDTVRYLKNVSRQVRADILRMTHLAGSGKPGGSMSSVEILVTLLAAANISPQDAYEPKRDRIVLSNLYASPALYATLGRFNFFDLDDVVGLYRKAGSIFEGNLDRTVRGVEWACGAPGAGLAVACGQALAARCRGLKPQVFVVMSDEEQQRGMIAEARRLAKKYRVNNLTAFIDANNVQSGGKVSEMMPQNLKYEYISSGWDVIEINGHDHNELYMAMRRATQIQSTPVLILANTVMGQGITFMESQPEYYERTLSEEEYQEGMQELQADPDLSEFADYRLAFGDFGIDLDVEECDNPVPEVGEPRTYKNSDRLNDRKAISNALTDIVEANGEEGEPVAVIDCANTITTGLEKFGQTHRENFIQAGLGSSTAATMAGAMSIDGVLAVFTDEGDRSMDEVFNVLRLNDLNRANLKVVATNVGLEMGAEGKAAQCIDYIGLTRNLYGFKLISPADPNQADRAFRYMVRQPGNWVMALGRDESPVINQIDSSEPAFAGDYEFEYGKVDLIREGEGGVIITTGQMLPKAIEAWKLLQEEGQPPRLLYVSCPATVDIDEDPLLLKSLRMGRAITYEDHNVRTGLGSVVANLIARRGTSCRLMTLGLDNYSMSGSPDDLYKASGLDVESLVTKARKFLKR